MQRKRKEFQDKLADAGTQAEEALSSIRTVRMFSGEKKANDLYGKDIEKSYQVGKQLALAQGETELVHLLIFWRDHLQILLLWQIYFNCLVHTDILCLLIWVWTFSYGSVDRHI